MRSTILLASILITSCSWQSGDVEMLPVPDASMPTINAEADVSFPEEPPAAVAPTIESQNLGPLTRAQLRALADANDDVGLAATRQRKAIRRWLDESKESAAMRKVNDARTAIVTEIGKEKKRRPECLVVLLGKAMQDAENIAKACGAEQWAIAESGAVVGGK